jgi:hypothetical protein
VGNHACAEQRLFRKLFCLQNPFHDRMERFLPSKGPKRPKGPMS